jgi:exonuclease III
MISPSSPPSDFLRVLSWNIDGNTALKLSCPLFTKKLKMFHIAFLQETHLSANQADSIIIPEGWHFLSITRNYFHTFHRQFGGILAVIRDDIVYKHRRDLSSPDIIVIELNSLFIVNAYILPELSKWDTFTLVNPFDKLTETLHVLSVVDKPTLVLGDLNARTALLSPGLSSRISEDGSRPASSRGRMLVTLCNDTNTLIMNGLSEFGPKNSEFTSFQPRGNAVVDYGLLCGLHQPLDSGPPLSPVRRFDVLTLDPTFSDHCPIAAFTDIPMFTITSRTSRPLDNGLNSARRLESLPNVTMLDKLFIETLAAKKSDAEKFTDIYGVVFYNSSPSEIFIYSCISSRSTSPQNTVATVGTYAGTELSAFNFLLAVKGSATTDRADLFALYNVLRIARPSKAVNVFTSTSSLYNFLLKDILAFAKQSWRVRNGDLLEAIVNLIKQRHAPLIISQIEDNGFNKRLETVKSFVLAARQVVPWDNHILPDSLHPPMGLVDPDSCLKLDCEKVRGAAFLSKRPLSKSDHDMIDLDFASNATVKHTNSFWYKAQKDMRIQLLNASSPSQHWKIIKDIIGSKDAPNNFSPEDFRSTFEKRMNPISPAPPCFDISKLHLDKLIADSIPLCTVDNTEEKFFSTPISEEEVGRAKVHFAKKSKNSSSGIDNVGYDDLMDVDDKAIAKLLNQCLDHIDAPSTFFTTVIIALVKIGKSKSQTENYRAIALESCTLKLLTLIIHHRISEWCDAHDIIPETQNGFRKGFRTNNNAFILRCSIDKAHALGTPLFVVFADLSNAFPSTEHSTLWIKMRRHGAGGKIFDWLRMIYKKMSYVVRHNGQLSNGFLALVGILMGDTASPTLWNFFFSDFKLLMDIDDIELFDFLLGNLEQADDIVLLSKTANGLQRKMIALYGWCSKNFMVLNAVKSHIMVFGHTPYPQPAFLMGNEEVKIVIEHTYIGVTFSSSNNIFMKHYEKKAIAARHAGNSIFGIEDSLGFLPVDEALNLYNALVDPHLTHGADVCIDVAQAHLSKLERIQHYFVRRLLGLPTNSLLVALFTETGLLPLKFRRLLVALNYLKYLVNLPLSRLARKALEDSITLDRCSKRSWVRDLRTTLANLTPAVTFPDLGNLNVDLVNNLLKGVQSAIKLALQNELESNQKLYLLHHRLEINPEGSGHKQVALLLRHYLKIPNRLHRISLTRLLFSCHPLALEKLRQTEFRRPKIPRELRLCRFCRAEIESPEHALFQCIENPEIINLRNVFATSLANEINIWDTLSLLNPLAKFRTLLSRRDTIGLFAKFAHEVISIYEATPLLIPSLPLHWLIQPEESRVQVVA